MLSTFHLLTHDVLNAGTAGRQHAYAFALCAQLVGDRRGDQLALGVEMGVEGAVGQPRLRHQYGDP
jgi:hypothetical protein